LLKAYPTVKVEIDGHTDNVGDPAANKKLSQERGRVGEVRADAVWASRPTASSPPATGRRKPVAPNDTEEGRAKKPGASRCRSPNAEIQRKGACDMATPKEYTPDELSRRTIARRAVEAVIWGMPVVNFDLMAQAALRAGARYNQVAYWSRLSDWKNQTLTPNPTRST
jgi:hypothetical protein